MREKFLAFCKGGPASAAKTVAAIMAFYALYCQFMGKEAKQLDVNQLTILATVLFSILAAHLDSVKIARDRKVTAVVRDAKHEINATKIDELASKVERIESATNPALKIEVVPRPAVPADKLREIIEREKGDRSS